MIEEGLLLFKNFRDILKEGMVLTIEVDRGDLWGTNRSKCLDDDSAVLFIIGGVWIEGSMADLLLDPWEESSLSEPPLFYM